jgi:uncharacterized protein YukE
MPILHMETELVRGVGHQLQQASNSVQQQSQQLHYSVQSLANAWHGPSADIFVIEIQPLLQQLNHFANSGDTLNQRLQREVDEWQQVGSRFGPGNRFNIPDVWAFAGGTTAFLGQAVTGDGSNFWQTWGQIGEPTDLFPHTNYHLMHGAQSELKGRYLAGEMTWDELLRNLEKMEDSLESGYPDTNFTLYKFAEGQGEAGAAVWRDDWGGDNWNASLRAVSAEAKGNYDFKLSEKGLEGKLQGEAGIYAVRGQYNAEVAGVDVALDGYVGAQAQGQMGAVIGPTALMGTAGVSAFAGGRVDGAIAKEAELVGGVKTKGEARGSVSYGVGFKAEIDGVLKPGVIKADVDFGATFGLGAELGFSVDLDLTGAVDNAVGMGRDLVDFGSSEVRNIFAR